MNWSLLFPTDYEGEEKRQMVLLGRILKSSLIFLFLEAILGYIAFSTVNIYLFLGGIFVLAILIGISWLLSKNGRSMQASFLYLVALWIHFVVLTFFNGGVSSPAPTTFIFGVIVAGLLLGERGSISFAGISVVTVVVLYFIETIWGLPPTPFPLSPLAGLGGFIVLLLSTTAVYRVTVGELKQTIGALSISSSEMETIFRAMNDAVFVMDADGRHTKIAPTGSENILIPHDEMLNKTVYEVLPEEQAKELHNYALKVIDSQQTLQVEYCLEVGVSNWWETTISPLGKNETVWIARNTTKHKQLEQALRHSNEALRESEANLRAAQRIAKLGIFEFNLETQDLRWSDEAYRIFGLEQGTEINLERYQSLLTPEDFDDVMTAVNESIASKQPYTIDHDIVLSDGQRRNLHGIGRPIVDEIGKVKRIFGTVQDATELKQVEKSLRESVAQYRALFENANDAIFLYGLDGRVVTANSKAFELTGYSLDEVIGKTGEFFTVPEEADEARQIHEKVIVRGERTPIYERTILHKDGTKRLCEITARLIEDKTGNPLFFQGVVRDITEQRRAEAQIQASLQEKEVLLKEIHHRVKNNLQVISSLLELQAGYIDDASVKQMIEESRNRVRSMAFVHEQLYYSTDLAQVDFATYIYDLTRSLERNYRQVTTNVLLNLDVDQIYLSVETAVPLGLIINELVSNALKHAFVDGRSGEVTLRLKSLENNSIRLTVADNGIGFPEELDFYQSPSLGLTIIMTLVGQIEGEIELSSQNGSRIDLVFPEKINSENEQDDSSENVVKG